MNDATPMRERSASTCKLHIFRQTSARDLPAVATLTDADKNAVSVRLLLLLIVSFVLWTQRKTR
jgi:hypothetical protein